MALSLTAAQGGNTSIPVQADRPSTSSFSGPDAQVYLDASRTEICAKRHRIGRRTRGCIRAHGAPAGALEMRGGRRAVLNGKKKSCPGTSFPKKARGHSMCSTMVGGGWRLAVGGGWRLAVGNWWLVAVGGGWRRLVVGDWWLVAVGSGWQLVVGRRWRLVVGCWWSLGAVLSKKKVSSLKDRPGRP